MGALALLALLGLGVFFATRPSDTPAPALPPKTEPTKTDGSKTPAKECPYGVDKPIGDLPEGVKNAVLAALTVESDPAELEKMAQSMDAVCQGVAAKALRDKAKLLKDKGIPDGWDPVKFPIPGTTSPMPATGFDVPDAPAGLPNLTPEMLPSWEWAPTGSAPSLPDVQWWSGPFSPSKGDSLYGLAKTLTGDGRRYVELIEANPEKPTVGDPLNPFSTGYSFLDLVDGERIRIPKSWNPFLSDAGLPL